jgi:protease PrsW
MMRNGTKATVFGVAPGRALLALAALVLVVGGVVMESVGDAAVTPALLLALLPLPFYIGFVLWLDRHEPEPWLLLSKCVLWGGGAAVLAAMLFNEAAFLRLVELRGVEAADRLSAVLVAPVVEELVKGLVLVLLFLRASHEVDGVSDGIVYAAMVGLGFAAAENVLFYGAALMRGAALHTFVLRGVLSPYAHPLFTALFGIGLGVAAERRGGWLIAAPALGLLAAIALHMVWNLSALLGLLGIAYGAVMAPTFFGALALFERSREREVARARLHAVSAPAPPGRPAPPQRRAR